MATVVTALACLPSWLQMRYHDNINPPCRQQNSATTIVAVQLLPYTVDNFSIAKICLMK